MVDCKYHGPSEAFTRKDGHQRCRVCIREAVKRRRLKVKQLLIAEAGGACEICGYKKSIAALEFHHKDPSTKEFALSGGGLTRSITIMRKEAAKCQLVCANCHRELEWKHLTNGNS